ncbi:MAG: hypothetical protein SPK23_08025 [Eubacteriales bacterium]|nr:hypothetical protein [Eubacteriales bacterium]
MNHFKVILYHDLFKFSEETEFSVEYENVHASFQYDKAQFQLIVELSSVENNIIDLEEEFIRLHLLFFLMMGSCPVIISKELNGNKYDIDELSVKFFTDKYYQNSHFCLCIPNSQNITESLLTSFKSITLPEKVSIVSFYSVQALISIEYEHVLLDHKLTLLLQALDGMINKEQGFNKKEVKSKIIKEWPEMPHQKISDLFCKLYFFASETLFPYENRCHILKAIGKDKKEFLEAIIHTRHFYSHMLSLNERNKRLVESKDFRVFFDILIHSIRLFWLKKLDANLDDQVTISTYNIFHDWLVYIYGLEDEPYLSGIYILHQHLKQLSSRNFRC